MRNIDARRKNMMASLKEMGIDNLDTRPLDRHLQVRERFLILGNYYLIDQRQEREAVSLFRADFSANKCDKGDFHARRCETASICCTEASAFAKVIYPR